SNSPKKFEYIGKKWLPELTFSSLLNKIKKVFKGDLIIEVKKIFCTDYYSRNEIVSVKIDDEELKAIKKLLVEYRTNLEYKKLLNEARRTKNFYNRQTLKAKLQEINPDITDDDIEKKFDRDKYDYRCYEVLKTNTKSEDVFLSLNGFLFILKDERTGIDWRIMETPGASAATYIFNAKLPINDLISKLVITPKSCIIADANIQNELGFIGRIVHRSYKQWKEQLEEVLKFKLVVSFLMTPDAVFQVEKIKKEYKK
ncbi:hypothetical protein KKF61_07140, partial [Patescibacteria group bacterium]|nr:hypothetical protein [Patescibacteria group bacterium]